MPNNLVICLFNKKQMHVYSVDNPLPAWAHITVFAFTVQVATH